MPTSQKIDTRMCSSRKLEGLSCKAPPTAFLAKLRVKEERPVKYTRIDYWGPGCIKTGDTAEKSYIETGDTAEKSYIALMACASSRTTRLELLKDLSAQFFYEYLKQFIRRQRMLKLIMFGNRRSFKASCLKYFIKTNVICWRFNLAKAPW